MNLKTILLSTLILVSASVWAQMAPKPGPEVKKLDYFVGTWSVEGTIAQGPWGAGGKFTTTDTNRMDAGQFLRGGAL